jgi:hypothetical protein
MCTHVSEIHSVPIFEVKDPRIIRSMEERDSQRLLANQQDPAALIRAVFVPVDIMLENSNKQR